MPDIQLIHSNLAKTSCIFHISEVKKIDIDSIVRKIFEGYESLVKPIQEALALQNIIKIINVPYSAKEIVKNRHFMQEKDEDKRIDRGLDVCNNVRAICETSGAFVFTLNQFKLIPFAVAGFAKPFTAVISFLSMASIATQYRTCLKIQKFMHSLNETNDVNKMIDLIKKCQTEDLSFIPTTFNTSEEKLVDAVTKTQEQKKVAQGLKDRVKSHLVSSSVSLVAATISLIGTAILLVITSPPIGWMMLGVGIAVDVEQFLYRKYREYNFSRAIHLERTAWEWVTC